MCQSVSSTHCCFCDDLYGGIARVGLGLSLPIMQNTLSIPAAFRGAAGCGAVRGDGKRPS
eukprot:4729067-Ditylum_brightwellii.AAC.1